MKRKSHSWVETLVSVQSPLQKLIFGNSCQNLCESRYQSFSVLSSFTWFCYFLQSILSLIVANSTYSGLSNVRFFVSTNIITQKLKESQISNYSNQPQHNERILSISLQNVFVSFITLTIHQSFNQFFIAISFKYIFINSLTYLYDVSVLCKTIFPKSVSQN